MAVTLFSSPARPGRLARLFAATLAATLVAGALAVPSRAVAMQPQGPPQQNVTSLFAKALKAFQAGQLKAAGHILSSILKRYPDHQPSQLLLGRLLYRLGKVALAARHFSRVGPDLIGPDVAYEYGVSMFSIHACRRAEIGLSRVTEGGRTGDLASFYRGICQMRLHRWAAAEALLGKADDLPDYLQETRRQALTQVRDLARDERSGQLSNGNVVVIVPMPQVTAPQAQADSDGKKPPPPPPPVTSGWATVVTPSLTLTDVQTTDNYFGFANDALESRKVDGKVATLWKYNANQRANGGQPYFSLELDLEEVLRTATGNQVGYVAYTNDPNNTIERNLSTTSDGSTIGSYLIKPEGSWPIAGFLQGTAGYIYLEKFPLLDRNSIYKTGTKGPYAEFDAGKTTILKLTGGQTQAFDNSGKVFGTEVDIGADLARTIDSLALDFNVLHQSFTVKTPLTTGGVTLGPTALLTLADGSVTTLTGSVTKTWDPYSVTLQVVDVQNQMTDSGVTLCGEDQNLSAAVSGIRNLEFGGNVTLTGTVAQLANYKQLVNDPTAPVANPGSCTLAGTAPQVVASGTGLQLSALGSIKLAPVDWIYGLVSYKYQTTEFTGVDPGLTQNFEAQTPEITTVLTLQIQISKSF